MRANPCRTESCAQSVTLRDEACEYVKNLATQRGVRMLVKSKSMVTEEIHLSPALEKGGIKVGEKDFGEYIVQLRDEPQET
jgi:L-lactate dehydrogenase complex protein LldF